MLAGWNGQQRRELAGAYYSAYYLPFDMTQYDIHWPSTGASTHQAAGAPMGFARHVHVSRSHVLAQPDGQDGRDEGKEERDGVPRKRLRDKAEAAEDALVPHEPLSRVMRRALKPNTHVERSAIRTVQVRVCMFPVSMSPWCARVRAVKGEGGIKVRVAQVLSMCTVCACACVCAPTRAHARARGRFASRSS